MDVTVPRINLDIFLPLSAQCVHSGQNRLPTRSYWYQNKLWSLYFTIPKRTATQSNPSCRNLRSKLQILYGNFEKKIKNWSSWGKKPIWSTKLFQNLKTNSDSATQNSLITDKIPNETFFIRAQINFDRKRSIGRFVKCRE